MSPVQRRRGAAGDAGAAQADQAHQDESRTEQFTGNTRLSRRLQETLQGSASSRRSRSRTVCASVSTANITDLENESKQVGAGRLSLEPLMEALGGFAIAGALIYGGYRVIETGAEPGSLSSSLSYDPKPLIDHPARYTVLNLGTEIQSRTPARRSFCRPARRPMIDSVGQDARSVRATGRAGRAKVIRNERTGPVSRRSRSNAVRAIDQRAGDGEAAERLHQGARAIGDPAHLFDSFSRSVILASKRLRITVLERERLTIADALEVSAASRAGGYLPVNCSCAIV